MNHTRPGGAPDPDFTPALRLAREGRGREAVAWIERAVRETGGRAAHAAAAGALADVARMTEAEGDHEAAWLAVERGLALRSDFPDLHHRRARLLLALGPRDASRRAEARRALERALALHPGYAAARLEQALLDASEGMVGEALAALRALADECRVEEPRTFQAGLDHLARAEWEEAGVLLERALGAGADEHNAALVRVREMIGRGESARAANLLREILESHAGWPDLHYLLGCAESDEGHLDDAFASLARALELHPGFHAARVQLARVLAALGQTAQAADQVGLVLQQEPEHEAARALLERWTSRGRRGVRDFTSRKAS